MSEIILSINAGSSSVKISVYQSPTPSHDPLLLAEASLSGLTAPPSTLNYTRGDRRIDGQELPDVKTQEQAFDYILDLLTADEGLEALQQKEDIRFTCHRVVHGGDYGRSQVIDEGMYEQIEELSDLAPLHNLPALAIVKTSSSLLPHATNIAYFDSAFHASMPACMHTYPIDPEVARKNKLRKYGFHGISYSFIVDATSKHLLRPKSTLNLIALHLGSGASACCIRHGSSLDTSMGLTPLAGLPGATRSGSIDPSLMFHFTHSAGKPSRASAGNMHITQAEEILNRQSGWKALTGTTDFGAISRGEREEDRLAFDIFVDRIVGYVGSYFVKLGGEVDGLVFAGGIGEKGERLREEVVKRVQCLGFGVDEERNRDLGEGVVVDVTRKGARFRTLVCKTDEQLQMARGVVEDRGRFERGETSS